MLRAERSLLEQRLQHQLRASNVESTETGETRRDLEKSLQEIQALYKSAVLEHEDRIMEINKSHAKQCEQLCREVVLANQEAARLQKTLSTFTRGAHTIDRSIVNLGPSNAPVPKSRRRRNRFVRFLVIITVCALFALFDVKKFAPPNGSDAIARMHSIGEQTLSQVADLAAKGMRLGEEFVAKQVQALTAETDSKPIPQEEIQPEAEVDSEVEVDNTIGTSGNKPSLPRWIGKLFGGRIRRDQ